MHTNTQVCLLSVSPCSGIRDLRGTADVFHNITHVEDRREKILNLGTFRETENYNSTNCQPADLEKVGDALQVTLCVRTQRVIMVTPNASHSMLVKYRG